MGMFMRRGAPTKVTVVTGHGSNVEDKYGYVTINGVKYTGRNTLEVYRGTVVDVYVGGFDSTVGCYVQVGKRVVKKGGGTYQYTVLSPSRIYFYAVNPNSGNEYNYCRITRT